MHISDVKRMLRSEILRTKERRMFEFNTPDSWVYHICSAALSKLEEQELEIAHLKTNIVINSRR